MCDINKKIQYLIKIDSQTPSLTHTSRWIIGSRYGRMRIKFGVSLGYVIRGMQWLRVE